uniref:Large ribosomal subunit protein uL5c n=1 Tax=Binuclearia lauterbornii TaxID=3087189 RepID=A0A097KPD4_9CHLO|nr:ribosomal protein L5 [Binuclearia lauterbornii]AIT95041.1 ribosomal protein L5 [Binuclearia lauterbornii]
MSQDHLMNKYLIISSVIENNTMTQRLKTLYYQQIIPKLMEEFTYKNKYQVPQIEKIVINRGLGDASQNAKLLDSSLNELTLIAGQKGIVTRSKKAIAGFKVREKMPVGISVTLRGERMYGFLDRLINLALPRIRDFQGINPKSFDGHGNYSIGLEEQLMFPEIDYDKIDQLRGMDISIVTTSKNDQEGVALLKAFGLPFKIDISKEK